MDARDESTKASEAQRTCANDATELATVGQRIERIGEAVRTAARAGHDAKAELVRLLDVTGRVDRSPYAMMIAAAGVGYMLAGGLLSPLSARVLGLGLRMTLRAGAIPFIRRALSEVAGTQKASGRGAPDSECGFSCVNVGNEERYCDEYQGIQEAR